MQQFLYTERQTGNEYYTKQNRINKLELAIAALLSLQLIFTIADVRSCLPIRRSMRCTINPGLKER
jgi:hypothetical protein